MTLLCLVGCGGDEKIEAFEKRYRAALTNGEYGKLFDMLDATSRRQVERQLEQFRGLDESAQQAVIDALGRDDVTSLTDLKGPAYFAILWKRIVGDAKPDVTIEAVGERGGKMTLKTNGAEQTFDLAIEGGRWTWRLPEQTFATQQTDAKKPSDPPTGKAGESTVTP